MNCKNCGAAMAPVSGQAYFRCEHCGTFEFPNATDDGVATLDEVVSFACPICDRQLKKAAIDGHIVSHCEACRGFFTRNDEFTRILAIRRAACGDRPAMPREISKQELKRRIHCPKCRKFMDAHPYGGGGAVVVDTCDRCSLIWLDAGEMDTLARHRPSGVGMPPLYQSEPISTPSNPSPPAGIDVIVNDGILGLIGRLF
jgi:Zn-finger nucleic acid-binding protein